MMTGFLGTGAPLAIDLIVVGLTIILPVLCYSIATVRAGQHGRHRSLQIAITVVLALALIFFEWQVRALGGWRSMIAYRALSPSATSLIGWTLAVHLVFSITTPMLWVAALMTSGRAWTGQQPRRHRFVARLAAADLILTAVTGWLWYYLAFVRTYTA